MGDRMSVKIINPAVDRRWNRFVAEHTQGTVFHSPAWISLLSETYKYKPFAYVSIDSGTIHAGIPFLEISNLLTDKRWVSLPFTDYCPPLYTDLEDLQAILEYLIDVRKERRLKSIEIRFPVPATNGIFQDNSFVLHTLKLSSDLDALFKSFSKKFRQYPRKAERDGLYLETYDSIKDIEIFYGLHLQTRKKLGVPVQPKRFFDLLWRHVIDKELGKVILAFYKDKPISASVVLTYKKHAMIKYSASDPSYFHLHPHYFIFLKSIEWAAQNGSHEIDFGKTEVDNLGLRKFKDGWGVVEEPLPYSYIASSPPSSGNGLLQRIGSTVIRHSPSFVCRGIGEAFYKYFG